MPFFAGLDLGQAADYSALSVVEQHVSPDGIHCYDLRLLDRWRLGTPYPVIVRDVAAKFSRHPLRGCPLCIDNTGVGRAVFDIFKQQQGLLAKLIPITIVNAFQPNMQKGEWHVPKKDLVGVLQVLFGTAHNGRKRLLIAKELKEAKALEREIATFRVKVNKATGYESFEAWRARDHDDLVLAVALPLWFAERGGGKHPAAGQFKILRYGDNLAKKREHPWFLLATRAEYDALALDQRHLVVSFGDPDSPWERPKNASMVDCVRLEFLDTTPAEGEVEWDKVREPFGKPLKDLVLRKDQVKALWSMLAKARPDPFAGIVFLDDGGSDRRAESAAKGVAGAWGFPRSAVRRGTENVSGEAQNGFVYEEIKRGRSLTR